MGLMRDLLLRGPQVQQILDILGAGAAPATPPDPARRYDRLIDAVNRLPRPLAAYGTLALLAFGVISPAEFANRMAGLEAMPEPLWWLAGAVIGFYFSAREAHHFRGTRPERKPGDPPPPAPGA